MTAGTLTITWNAEGSPNVIPLGSNFLAAKVRLDIVAAGYATHESSYDVTPAPRT